MSAADNLRAARALIEDPKRWTRHVYARDEYGGIEAIRSGVCFCLLGATARAVNPNIDCRLIKVLDEVDFLAQAIGKPDDADPEDLVVAFNDKPGRTHAEVLAAFDKAIELAEAQQ
jgi:hypothetical protein